ncbi:hypothetical protein D0869_00293 [Hortaea werneckii]|uniref:Nuclear distribution protein RO10 n=1 Tax=Hortaea werneckii TaxID=91943 RepID=A0A3M6XHB1_HORWE|nr:hypothetical protein KC324_g4176 [Hortaea werneckii]KAI7588984.1 hypothetical protein KC316_g4174 [Hortaea werneckii]RMX90204.1 hypothetical protein D0869_00293 [Hortaea werneckii]RMY14359.1 hypothetical protein D0868_01510 [Hortaea werneckii]
MSQKTAADTLALLEERIRRIDHLLHGRTTLPSSLHETDPDSPPTSATARLRKLERSLASLLDRSPAAHQAIALQKSHPHLFSSNPTTPTDLPTFTLATLVLAHSHLYTNLSTQLTQLQSTPLPDSTPLTHLIDLQPRITELQTKQKTQAQELADLRSRSALAVEKWYTDGVMEMGEQWADWEERVREVEILVRRREAARRREEEGFI